VKSPWVLALDADYVCPQELPKELRELAPRFDAYQASFAYCINGRALRGTLYPPRAVLFRADQLRYRQDGHTQILDCQGPVGAIRGVILHDDRKPLTRWLENQAKNTLIWKSRNCSLCRTARSAGKIACGSGFCGRQC
jgi:hypothetical protein